MITAVLPQRVTLPRDLPDDLPPAIPLFPEWYDDAACIGVDVNAFSRGKGYALGVIAKARALWRASCDTA